MWSRIGVALLYDMPLFGCFVPQKYDTTLNYRHEKAAENRRYLKIV
jgi:hypothetical protein